LNGEDEKGEVLGLIKKLPEIQASRKYGPYVHRSSGEVHFGPCIRSKCHGTTIKVSRDKIFLAESNEGDFHNGFAIYDNGDFYSGGVCGCKKRGKGHYKCKSGASFQGEFRNDKRFGPGLFTYPNGSLLKGGWNEGKKIGKHLHYNILENKTYVERFTSSNQRGSSKF